MASYAHRCNSGLNCLGGAIDCPLIGFEACFHRKMGEAPHLEL